MINKKQVAAIIDGRTSDGSYLDMKLRLMNGLPMILYSMEHAIKSCYTDKVVVITNDGECVDIIKKYDSSIICINDKDISDIDFDYYDIKLIYNWLKENEGCCFDYVVKLDANHPIRGQHDIDSMLELLDNNKDATSVNSVSFINNILDNLLVLNDNNCIKKLSDIFDKTIEDNTFSKVYKKNDSIVVIDYNEYCKTATSNSLGYSIENDVFVHSENTFLIAEQYLMLDNAMKNGKKLTIVCDIDGVIAGKTENNDYNTSFPLINNINIINSLYDKGHTIILFTARGYVTGIDWRDVTEEQLSKWDVKYSELKFNKPNADIYIDDKFYLLESLKDI